MPIYEYRCEKGHDFEVMQKMGDDALTVCEVCEAPVRKVFRPVAVHFKGSGFYNTDYGTRKSSREKESAEGAKSEGSKDSKSDSGASKSDSGKSKSESGSSTATPTSTPKAATGDYRAPRGAEPGATAPRPAPARGQPFISLPTARWIAA